MLQTGWPEQRRRGAAVSLLATPFIVLCFILALAIIWQLIKAAQGSSHVPSIVGGLIGVAFGIVLWQAAWVLVTPQAPPRDDTSAKLVAETQAREKAIATLTGRLDELAKKLSAAQADIAALKVKPPPEPQPPPPPSPRLRLDRLEVRPVKGRHPPFRLYPQTSGGTIQFASIDFCRFASSNLCPPKDGPYTPAANTPPIAPGCTESLVCNGAGGKFVTIPASVANGKTQICIRLTYSLQDGTRGVVLGGPIDPSHSNVWLLNANAQNPCGKASGS